MTGRAPRELRDRSAAEAWLAGSLCLMRLGQPGAERVLPIAPWVVQVLSERGDLPPAGVIADIGALLSGASLRSMQPLPALPVPLSEVLHAYEDHVLGRLEADPRLDAVIDALAALPPELRDRAVALFAMRLLERARYRAGVAVSPGMVKTFIRRPVDEIYSRGHAALIEGSPVFEILVAGYQELIAGARRVGMLISAAEVFFVENFDALGELTQRVAIEQIIEAADALSATLPRRLKPGVRTRRGRIPTPLVTDDSYPTGGFSSLSTSGSIENLVVSELIYMEDPPSSAAAIDLFDVRYAEGELLYYTRDESVFIRGRRVITFALMPDLETIRVKDPHLPWQRHVLLFGLITCCVRRLSEWLAGEGLLFRVIMVRDDQTRDVPPLAAERALCALALREFVVRDMAEISEAPSLSAVLEQVHELSQKARGDLVIVAAGPIEVAPLPAARAGVITLGDAAPVLTWQPDLSHRSKDADLWRAWSDLALALLQGLM